MNWGGLLCLFVPLSKVATFEYISYSGFEVLLSV